MVFEVDTNGQKVINSYEKTLKFQQDDSDKYEKTVEFQNECRSFYLNRVKATAQFKHRMHNGKDVENKNTRKTSLALAMDKLRNEMASLVDQDLSLMKQMLTLNETIEELKNKRLYGVSKDSVDGSMSRLNKSMSTMSIDSGSVSEFNNDCSSEEDSPLDTVRSYTKQFSEDSGYGE